MHIYVFGSLSRGEVRRNSDVDLLALVEGRDDRFDPDKYSIYSYSRIKELWSEGNPFAWHLFGESRLVFSSTGEDFIEMLGRPDEYRACARDCRKFRSVFGRSREAFYVSDCTAVFELSTIFLSIRNFATCYSLGMLKSPCFSRDSALRLGLDSIELPLRVYEILERCRLLCTRGEGMNLDQGEIQVAEPSFLAIERWMDCLLEKVEAYERVQQPDRSAA